MLKIKSNRHALVLLLSAVTVAFVMMVADHLMMKQIRAEAVRQATRQQESSMMMFWEFMDRKGRNFRIEDGLLYVGDYYVLNDNNELPDRILAITGSRATVFMGDVRIATNVVHPDGRRAIGTRLTGPAYQAVFRQGTSYRGEANILGIPYFTAYDPIRNIRGEVIGALFVGVKQSEYLARYNQISGTITAINGTLAAVFVLFAALLIWNRRRSEETVQEQLAFQQLLLDTVPTPIFSKDREGRYSGCNKAFEEYVGLRSDEVIGRTVHELWATDLADKYHRMDLKAMEMSGVQSYESAVQYADGSLHDVIFHKAPFRDLKGAPAGLVGVLLDITERKAAEAERNKLEAEKHHSRMMEALMVQLNHDLRTPLTPLFALFPLIRKKVNDPQLDRMLEICQQSINQVQGLVGKSLDLIRLSSSAGLPEATPVGLAAAAECGMGATASLLAQRGVSCVNQIDPRLRVLACSDQLTLLFQNLLSNAARYAAQNGTVLLGAEVREDQVQVSVQDDGEGLDPQHLPLVFYEFYKADRARHDLNTQGLGLAICKKIVANHGGRIWAESLGKGQGCTMLFTLKLAQEELESGRERAAAGGSPP